MILRKRGRTLATLLVFLIASVTLICLTSPRRYKAEVPSEVMTSTRGEVTPSDSAAICWLGDNNTVHTSTGNYTECVAKWLFTVDSRTKPIQYVDSGTITDAYRTSGMLPRCYFPPPATNATGGGTCFRVTDDRLRRLGLPATDFHVVNKSNVADFVFVTAISDSHFLESLDAIASVQKYMSDHRIIVYDLGITDSQLKKMITFCHVTMATFRGDSRLLYPSHVSNLATYAFKPLIILEALRTYPAIVWLDSSARLYESLRGYYPKIIQSGGLFLLAPPPKRSVVHHTHPDVYKYFPTHTRQLQYTRILMPDGYYARAEGIYWSVLWWWVMCALTEDCIYPVKIDRCSPFDATNVMDYIGCHRYDMAVLNLLLANYHGYNYSAYGGKRKNSVFEKLRKQTHKFDVKVCLKHGKKS